MQQHVISFNSKTCRHYFAGQCQTTICTYSNGFSGTAEYLCSSISSDLSPIEHVWDDMTFINRRGNGPNISQIWNYVPQASFNTLMGSMRRRYQARINGGEILFCVLQFWHPWLWMLLSRTSPVERDCDHVNQTLFNLIRKQKMLYIFSIIKTVKSGEIARPSIQDGFCS